MNMDIKRVAFSVTSLKTNQYITLLCDALQQEGVSVSKISWWDVVLKRVQVIHIHWPEHFLRDLRKPADIKLLLVFLLTLLAARALKTPVIWTVHNTWPHDSKAGPKTLKRFFSLWAQLVNACIYMSPSTRAETEIQHRHVRNKPYAVIPHGHYREVIPATLTRAQAREQLGIDSQAIVLSQCGIIKAYKNTLALSEYFSTLPDPRLRLVIAGKCGDAYLAERLALRARNDSRILFLNHRLPDSEMAAITFASDLVALPYTQVANSGVALFALSANRPVLGPNQGAFRDLQARFPGWFFLYDGDFLQPHLQQALAWLCARDPAERLDLSELDWCNIAARTKEFYLEQYRRLRSPVTQPLN
jgi:beta-1,4-mannosyltransferase